MKTDVEKLTSDLAASRASHAMSGAALEKAEAALLASGLVERSLREALGRFVDRHNRADGRLNCGHNPADIPSCKYCSSERALSTPPSAAAVRAEAIFKVLADAEKWIDIRPDFTWSMIDTDYARVLLKAADKEAS